MFNTNSHKKNALLSSSAAAAEQVIQYVMQFVYRTCFLMVLSKNYLGINGLFSNVLQIFSIAELGIGSIISYRMYAPVKEKNVERCAALLNFYKQVYRYLFIIVMVMGVLFFPFIDSLIADASEVPADINLNVIYWMFVVQSASSYLFVYRQSLLSADQKNYILSGANAGFSTLSNLLKILILVITANYTLSLLTGIVLNILFSMILSLYIKKSYTQIVSNKTALPRQEKIGIFKDTMALLCHKVGYVALNATDSLILSKNIGLAVLGIYSNYSLITVAIDTVLNRIFGSFVSTIGQISLEKETGQAYTIYRRLNFMNLWVSSFCTVCVWVLISDFIELWQDKTFLLDAGTVMILSANLFLTTSYIINSTYINAHGLFVRDRMRPLIQAAINLAVSIALVKCMGIGGVFLGTFISVVCTTWWRIPVLLYTNVFKKSVWGFFLNYFKWALCTVLLAIACKWVTDFITVSWLGWIAKLLVCCIVVNGVYLALYHRSDEVNYFIVLLKNMLSSRRKKEAE